MWPRFLSSAIGIWLMAAPAVLGHQGAARTHAVIVGPIVATVAIVAMSEVMRPVRWLNGAAGLWLLLAPWALGLPGSARWNALVTGLALVLLAPVRGRMSVSMGGGWRAIPHGGEPPRAAGDGR